MYKKLLFFFLFVSTTTYSQNLLLNGDFEIVDTGTSRLSILNIEAYNWFRINSVDVYCNIKNGLGPCMQDKVIPKSGNNFIGMTTFNITNLSYREYFLGTLSQPVVKNKAYVISLYYLLDESSSFICTNLHTFFLESFDNDRLSGKVKMNITDTLSIPIKKNIKGGKWQNFTDTIFSSENSKYFGIGNLLSNNNKNIYKRRQNVDCPDSYIYFDNISVIPVFDKELDTLMDANNIDGILITEDSLPSFRNIIFDNNSSIVKDTFITKIKYLAEYINTKNFNVELTGFTDNIGDEQFNLSLSEKRVVAVRLLFLKNKVDSNKIQIKYLGESNALNLNTNESQRLENRRVEIGIYRTNK